MKKPEPTPVTAAELAVLEVLWARGDISIREIALALYPGGGTSEYATVQKLLERLQSKGFVARDRRSFAHTFKPLVERGKLIGLELEKVAEKLCEGSMTPLLTHLVEMTNLSAEDRAALRHLLDEDSKKRRR